MYSENTLQPAMKAENAVRPALPTIADDLTIQLDRLEKELLETKAKARNLVFHEGNDVSSETPPQPQPTNLVQAFAIQLNRLNELVYLAAQIRVHLSQAI